MTQEQIVLKNPTERRSFKQAKAIFGIAMSLYNNKDKASALSAKPKTKAQASAMIKQLLKVKAKQS